MGFAEVAASLCSHGLGRGLHGYDSLSILTTLCRCGRTVALQNARACNLAGTDNDVVLSY
jgi:hypothetical protein